MTEFFCLDIGGSNTRGALYDGEGRLVARGTEAGGALSLGVERAEAAIRAVWREICDKTDRDSAIAAAGTRLCAGIAGKGLRGAAEALRVRLADFETCLLVGDGYGALLAATGGKPGALISIGTGVTALRLNEHGTTLALSGWGFPAGDTGGGSWLGRLIVEDFLKHLDGIVLNPAFPEGLAGELVGEFGAEVRDIMLWQTGAKPGQFGKLVPLLVHLAKQHQPYARAMLFRAAAEIVQLADTLCVGKGDDLWLAGGLGAVLQPYCAGLDPARDWRVSTADAVEGVLLLARGLAPEERLLPRPGLARSVHSAKIGI